MKKIMAIIRPNKLQVVKEALDDIGIPQHNGNRSKRSRQTERGY